MIFTIYTEFTQHRENIVVGQVVDLLCRNIRQKNKRVHNHAAQRKTPTYILYKSV